MTVRSIPAAYAGLLTQLELDRPTIVTTELLDRALDEVSPGGHPPSSEVARRLRELGWLLPLRSRNAWEFAPADRAGAYSGGDPFVELRAALAVHPDTRIGVGLESAAFLRSLASRQPVREVLIFDENARPFRALDDYRRVSLTLPDSAYGNLTGLRVQVPTAILATIAIRPGWFRDWPGLAEWLAAASGGTDESLMIELLQGRPASAWARAEYLLASGGNAAAAEQLGRHRPAGSGPHYLGPRREGRGVHDRNTDVIDTVIARYSDATQGPA